MVLGISYKSLISPLEILDNAAIQLIFPPDFQTAFPEFAALQNPIISQCGVCPGLYNLD